MFSFDNAVQQKGEHIILDSGCKEDCTWRSFNLLANERRCLEFKGPGATQRHKMHCKSSLKGIRRVETWQFHIKEVSEEDKEKETLVVHYSLSSS